MQNLCNCIVHPYPNCNYKRMMHNLPAMFVATVWSLCSAELTFMFLQQEMHLYCLVRAALAHTALVVLSLPCSKIFTPPTSGDIGKGLPPLLRYAGDRDALFFVESSRFSAQ